MTPTAALQRLRAWKDGRPVPLGRTLPWPRLPNRDRLVLAFVRMAGESLPWGVAYGAPGEKPNLLTVAEPRNRDVHAAMALELAEVLLPHLPHPQHSTAKQRESAGAAQGDGLGVRRQLWLPGATHIEVLHFLDFRYTLARKGEEANVERLNALGRACGWLFRESTRPGQVRVLDATRLLRDSFAFPADDTRQSHLGFLLAWLGRGNRETRWTSASKAELDSVGITLDPELERKDLQPLVEEWNEAFKASPNGKRTRKLADRIADVLTPELERRWHLTVSAMERLESDRVPNPELGPLLELASNEFFYQYWRPELRVATTADVESSEAIASDDAPPVFRFRGNHPESDFHPPAAASRYFAHVHASELTAGELLHGDEDLVRGAMDAGDAVSGKIENVRDEGTGRTIRAVWHVRCSADRPLRLREGSGVCVLGLRKRKCTIREIHTDAGGRLLVVDVTSGFTKRACPDAPEAHDAKRLRGRTVTLVSEPIPDISRKKQFAVWNSDGPGAWLTHAAPVPLESERPSSGEDLVSLVEKIAKR